MRQPALDAVKRWRGDPASLRHVSDSTNHVYSFTAAERLLFLRLASAARRSLAQIEAELDFIDYLHRGGLGVALPVPSARDRLVESLEWEGTLLHASAFEEAPGDPFAFGSDEFNREHFRLRGRTIGRMHVLSKGYVPARGHRPRWDEDDLLSDVGSYLPRAEGIAWAEYERLKESLGSRPADRGTFGLIHGDFGSTNLRFRNGALTVFDFDDSCYHWYAYDVAITLYPHGWRQDARALTEALTAGYAEEAPGGRPSREELVLFCSLRQLYMFLHHVRTWGLGDLTAEQRRWLAQKRENIARGYALPEC